MFAHLAAIAFLGVAIFANISKTDDQPFTVGCLYGLSLCMTAHQKEQEGIQKDRSDAVHGRP